MIIPKYQCIILLVFQAQNVIKHSAGGL